MWILYQHKKYTVFLSSKMMISCINYEEPIWFIFLNSTNLSDVGKDKFSSYISPSKPRLLQLLLLPLLPGEEEKTAELDKNNSSNFRTSIFLTTLLSRHLIQEHWNFLDRLAGSNMTLSAIQSSNVHNNAKLAGFSILVKVLICTH